MNDMSRRLAQGCRAAIGACAMALLAACQTPPGATGAAGTAPDSADVKPVTAPPPVKEELPPADFGQIALQDGIDLYNRGEFAAAYKRLQESPDIAAASPAVRTEAFKYAAFSACAQNRRTQCRQAFDKLLALQSDYELKDAEAKHPVWGPVFKQAKQAQARQAQQGQGQQAPPRRK